MINVAIQEDLPNTLALVARSMKALLLRQPNQWVRCSRNRGSEDGSLITANSRASFLRPDAQRRVPPQLRLEAAAHPSN
jgi:hypothetical protein